MPDETSYAEALESIKAVLVVALDEAAPLKEKVLLLQAGVPVQINPWCGLCGSPSTAWIYEVAPTRERNWDAAVKELRGVERAQMKSAEYLKSIGAAFDGPAPTGSLN
jgi:hypothetical protein